MLVLQPTKEGLSIHAVTALLMALVVAARELITRHITAEVPTNVITFTSTMGVCLAGFAGIDTQPWVPLTANNFTLLFVSAILVTMGVWFVVVAFREVEVSVVSPFRYSAVLWAALFGFLVWNEIPNDLAIIGTALIVMSGIFAMHQDSQSARERAAAQQPAE
jgi:drug/metabolite transporter (DMT)-like permease